MKNQTAKKPFCIFKAAQATLAVLTVISVLAMAFFLLNVEAHFFDETSHLLNVVLVISGIFLLVGFIAGLERKIYLVDKKLKNSNDFLVNINNNPVMPQPKPNKNKSKDNTTKDNEKTDSNQKYKINLD